MSRAHGRTARRPGPVRPPAAPRTSSRLQGGASGTGPPGWTDPAGRPTSWRPATARALAGTALLAGPSLALAAFALPISQPAAGGRWQAAPDRRVHTVGHQA